MESSSGILAGVLRIFVFVCFATFSSAVLPRIVTTDQWEASMDENIYLYTRHGQFHSDPQYLVIASEIVRPGQVYRVAVSLLSAPQPLLVRASLHRDGEQVASSMEKMSSGQMSTLLMQVPFNAIPGDYHLKVEGNVNGAPGGTGFRNETKLTFSERFLTILIQTNQLVYNLEQMMYIRVILLTTELKPFVDPVDVYLLDSRNFVMKRWVSVYPYLGFVNLEFELPYDFATGWWTIRVVALGQTEESRVLFERWFGHRFDVNVATPTFILNTDEYLEGFILANYSSVATVTGNATLRTSVRPLSRYRNRGVDWKDNYLEEYVELFHGTYDFSIPLEKLRRLAMPVPIENCEIEVQAVVGERFLDFVVTAYAKVRVVNASISLRFLGVSPQVF